MAVNAPVASSLYSPSGTSPRSAACTPIVVAGIVLALADRLGRCPSLGNRAACRAPWKLSFHESSRANLVSKQHFLTKYAAHITDQITALESQLVETENQTTKQISELRHLLGVNRKSAHVPMKHVWMHWGPLTPRAEWGMLLDAEREQFASSCASTKLRRDDASFPAMS